MSDLLIIGAGPYGLATASEAKNLGLDFDIVGNPMGFWREHMPVGMILRTGKEEHLDTRNIHTMDAFMAENGIPDADMIPLKLSRYLEYTDWFIAKKSLEITNALVTRLDFMDGAFKAKLSDRTIRQAKRVIVAIGMGDFKFIPPDLQSLVPPGRFSHSSDHSGFDEFRSKRILIVGGRQSAFETAALLMEHGAQSVHVVCRHETPQFTRCDFSFMHDILAHVAKDPAWHRNLPEAERDYWRQIAFREGRLKLESWLAPRLKQGSVQVSDRSTLVGITSREASLQVTLSTGIEVDCDHIIFATGFKPDIARLAFLRAGNIMAGLQVKDGSPVLDTSFQSSQSGLYFLGFLSIADMGQPFGFSTGAPTGAKLVTAALKKNGVS